MSLEAPRMMPKFLWRRMLLQIKMLLSYSGQRVRSSNLDNRNTEEPNWKMHWCIGNHISRCWLYVDEDKGVQSPITNKRSENGFNWFLFVELNIQSMWSVYAREKEEDSFCLIHWLCLKVKSWPRAMLICLFPPLATIADIHLFRVPIGSNDS